MCFLFLCVFLLKTTDAKLLKQQVATIFKVPFVKLETDDTVGILNVYQIVLFLFTIGSFSLVLAFTQSYFKDQQTIKFSTYITLYCFVFFYFIVKWILENVLVRLFVIKNQLKFFLISKWSYLFSLAFVFYIGTILYVYSFLNMTYLLFIVILFFLLRFIFILITNKKLVFYKLFYFILYICAFEIAPLFILFKLVFNKTHA